MNKTVYILILSATGLLCLCRNPFFPDTGAPVDQLTPRPRSTPQAMVDQLIESYESRSIDLFEDLLPSDGSFQFFIAPDFFNEYVTKHQQLSEARDTRLQYIGQSDYYHYWTQDEEIEAHGRLFDQAERIEFIDKPALQTIRNFTDKNNGDSLVEIVLTGGNMEIGHWLDGDTIEIFIVPIERQVFLLEKDLKSLWVIRKWYDFSTGE